MKATELGKWHAKFKPSEFPKGVLEHLDAKVLTDILFPLRDLCGVPLKPSQLADAHVRHEVGKSQHCTNKGTRLSTATDVHVSNHESMLKVLSYAEGLNTVGGIGIYFDTNTPMLHLDLVEVRGSRLVWLRNKHGKYVYRENNYIEFVKELYEQVVKSN